MNEPCRNIGCNMQRNGKCTNLYPCDAADPLCECGHPKSEHRGCTIGGSCMAHDGKTPRPVVLCECMKFKEAKKTLTQCERSMNDLTLWRLKHIPTGLYFKPSKHRSKSNLHKKGKIYSMKPTCKWMGGYYHHPDDAPEKVYKKFPVRKVIESEWVAEKVK